MFKQFFYIIILLFITTNIYAQNSEVLTNKSIIDLKTAGLGKTTIIGMITKSTCKFDTEIKDIVFLKKEGIEDDIINAMIDKGSKKENTNTAISEGASKIVEDLRKQGTGIYYLNNGVLQEVEPTVCSQSKVGSSLLTSMTYGLTKVKTKSSVSGSKSNLQLNDKQPFFYFYFNSDQKSLNQQASQFVTNATNPNEFMLIKFDVKKSERNITVGSANLYEGASSGVDAGNKRSFKFKKLASGIYEVYLENVLERGEYCFMYAGSVTANTSPKVYDFGIQ